MNNHGGVGSGANQPPHSAPRNRLYIAVVVVLELLIGFALFELTTRWLVEADVDGNLSFTIANTQLRLKPYKMPVHSTERLLKQYMEKDDSYIIHDPVLGWAPRPNSQSSDGLYQYNNQGIRSTKTSFTPKPAQGTLRIVLIGDSYVHGDEVRHNETWAHYLEQYLSIAGVQSEVINLGVPGYGMDQALLRWEELGKSLHPHIVVFGLQPENVKRNVNLFRKLYYQPARIFFSKPRFILSNTRLRRINVPTVPVQQIPEVLENFTTWEHFTHEYFYSQEDFDDQFWLRSKALALAASLASKVRNRNLNSEFFALESDPAQLALAIINEMERSVESTGATLIITSLAPTWFIKEENLIIPSTVEGFLHETSQQHQQIDTSSAIRLQLKSGEATAQDMVMKYHYSAVGNQIIARETATFLYHLQGIPTSSHQ